MKKGELGRDGEEIRENLKKIGRWRLEENEMTKLKFEDQEHK